ncbi:MAG: hypothetical protein HY782_01475 [Chloroflexi bacterium]|nr:hypothetical protein [Chloroflexota bacterium]
MDERDRLVAALAQNGIRFLAGGGAEANHLSPAELIASLARHLDPRLHLALTSLFLLHPDWAIYVPSIAATLDGAALVELQARYMAAVYLQRRWRTRLGYYLDDFPLLPDLYGRALGLPSPDERFGKTGLVALADWHAQRSAYPFNRLASYHKSAELLFGQLIAEARHHELATTG